MCESERKPGTCLSLSLSHAGVGLGIVTAGVDAIAPQTCQDVPRRTVQSTRTINRKPRLNFLRWTLDFHSLWSHHSHMFAMSRLQIYIAVRLAPSTCPYTLILTTAELGRPGQRRAPARIRRAT